MTKEKWIGLLILISIVGGLVSLVLVKSDTAKLVKFTVTNKEIVSSCQQSYQKELDLAKQRFEQKQVSQEGVGKEASQ